MNRRQTLGAAIGAALAAALGPAYSQGLGGKQNRIVVGYPAAGVADFTARTIAEGLNQSGMPTIVENRSGAAGNIAMEFVARQPVEAATYGVFANSLLTTNAFVPQLQSKNVDPFKDMVPVAALADMILVLAASSSLGVTTLDQFLAKARAPGARMRIGLAGIGTPHHLSALLLERAANLDVTLVPYKGGAPMIADAAGGHLDAVFTTIPVGGPMVAAGKLNWLAIAQPTTLKSLPGVPSLVKVFKGESVPSWIGVFAPSNTPQETVNTMHEALNTVVNSPAISAKLRANGMEPLALSRSETLTRIADEAKFMKDFLAKIKLDFTT